MSDIFEPEELEAEAVTADPQPDAPAAEPQADDVPRDEKGRFAPKADEPVADVAPEEKANMVPQGALHAEREKRKEFEGKWKEAQVQLDAIANLRKSIAERAPVVPEAPTPSAEPNAEIEYLKKQLAEVQGVQHQTAQQQQLSQVADAEVAHVHSVLTQAENAFRQTQPDYDKAIEHVVQARASELRLYGVPDVQIQQMLREEVIEIAKSAIQMGRSPAEVGYELAKLRGYRPEAPQAGTGSAQATVAAVKAAQAGSRSLGQASGGAPAGEINAQTIANMTHEEFEELYSTPEGRKLINAL